MEEPRHTLPAWVERHAVPAGPTCRHLRAPQAARLLLLRFRKVSEWAHAMRRLHQLALLLALLVACGGSAQARGRRLMDQASGAEALQGGPRG